MKVFYEKPRPGHGQSGVDENLTGLLLAAEQEQRGHAKSGERQRAGSVSLLILNLNGFSFIRPF